MDRFKCRICGSFSYVEIGETVLKNNPDHKTLPLYACANCNFIFLPGAVAYAKIPRKGKLLSLRHALATVFRIP